jgi:hypothetical protein
VEPVIKIVQPPIEPRLVHRVDFDVTDAIEWGRFAIKSTGWHMTFDSGVAEAASWQSAQALEAVVVIAAPDGRVAVWYGQSTIAGRLPLALAFNVARDVVGCSRVAAFWDKRRTKGGERDVRPLALAAGRVLHAQTFGEVPFLRDTLLAEFASLLGADRPDTSILLRASENALLAASALAAAQNYRGAQMLLTGKGVTA